MNEYTRKFIGLFVGVCIGSFGLYFLDVSDLNAAKSSIITVGVVLIVLRVSGIVK